MTTRDVRVDLSTVLERGRRDFFLMRARRRRLGSTWRIFPSRAISHTITPQLRTLHLHLRAICVVLSTANFRGDQRGSDNRRHSS